MRAFAEGFALASNEKIVVRRGVGRPRAVRLFLAPGGLVAISAPAGARSLELVSLATGRRDRLFLPRDAEVPMPAGTVVGLVSNDGQAPGAVSRLVDVDPRGAPVTLKFEPPAARAGDLVVRLDYPDDADAARFDAGLGVAGTPGASESSAASAFGVSPHYAVFYGLPAGRWTVDVRSQHWSAEPASVDIAAGTNAAVIFSNLLPRPTLTVEIALDPAFEAEARRLSLYRCAPGDWAASGRFDRERCPAAGTWRETRAVFFRLEARWHVLELDIGGRRMRRAVDLRTGEDLEEKFIVEATRLSGRVLRGKRGVPADVVFEALENPAAPIAVRAGPDGAYRVALWPQGGWRAQVVADRLSPEDAAFFPVDAPRPGALARSFELPPTEVRLALLDAKTKDPLPEASVAFLAFGKPRWRATDDSGEVRLSAVPAGPLEVHAEADGYRPRQAAVEIEDSSALQSFEIDLTPLEPGNEFQAVLASGLAAASARVFVGAAASGLERERVDCDGLGICRLAERPAETEGMVLAHPEGGFTVLSAGEALSSGRARLAPAGGILRLAPARGEALADALLQISVSIPGATLPPAWLDSLAFAIGRPSRTAVFPGARSGFFLSGLPAGPIVVTITAARRDESGAFGSPSVVAGPLALELPVEGAVEVELP